MPVVQWAFENKDSLCIGVKLELIAAMIRAAYFLSGSSVAVGITHEVITHPLEQDENGSAVAASKTTIKRPRRLELLQQKRNRLLNRFIPVAPSFCGAVMVALKTCFACKNIIREATSTEVGDNIETLLPSQCLFALAAFTRCTVNYSIRFEITDQMLLVAWHFKDSSSLNIRRAATAALCAGVEALFDQEFHDAKTTGYPDGILEALTNIHNLSVSQGGPQASSLKRAAEIVDWCVETQTSDADENCRQMKRNIITIAVRALEGN